MITPEAVSRGDLQDVGDGVTHCRQGVVPRGRHRGGEPGEDTGAVVLHEGRFAVHQFGRVGHCAAVGFGQRLVAQADAEHRLVVRRRTI